MALFLESPRKGGRVAGEISNKPDTASSRYEISSKNQKKEKVTGEKPKNHRLFCQKSKKTIDGYQIEMCAFNFQGFFLKMQSAAFERLFLKWRFANSSRAFRTGGSKDKPILIFCCCLNMHLAPFLNGAPKVHQFCEIYQVDKPLLDVLCQRSQRFFEKKLKSGKNVFLEWLSKRKVVTTFSHRLLIVFCDFSRFWELVGIWQVFWQDFP